MKQIINYTELSKLLTGNNNSIRKDKCPKKYKDKVGTLLRYLDYWHNDKEVRSLEEIKETINNTDFYNLIYNKDKNTK